MPLHFCKHNMPRSSRGFTLRFKRCNRNVPVSYVYDAIVLLKEAPGVYMIVIQAIAVIHKPSLLLIDLTFELAMKESPSHQQSMTLYRMQNGSPLCAIVHRF